MPMRGKYQPIVTTIEMRERGPIQATCPHCGWDGWCWIVGSDDRLTVLNTVRQRMHLACWQCKLGFYVQKRPHPPPPKRWFTTPEEVAALVALYAEVGSAAGCARAYGCSEHTIRNRLNAAGVRLRTKGEHLLAVREIGTAKARSVKMRRSRRWRLEAAKLRVEHPDWTYRELGAALERDHRQVYYALHNTTSDLPKKLQRALAEVLAPRAA